MSSSPPSPPPTLDQRAIIKDLFKKHGKLSANDKWYLISFKWYKLWKEHVGFDVEDDKPVTTSLTEVEPIDNTDLLNAGVSDASPRLKANMMEDGDYTLVPEAVWNMLHSWYGGGPAIPRVVILDGNGKLARVEVYQLNLKLFNTKKDGTLNISSEIDVEISKTATVADLKALACEQMELSPNQCRLWNNFTAKSSGWGKEMKDPAKTLEDATLVDGQKVIVEVQLEDGSWPKGKAQGLSSTSSSSSSSSSSSAVSSSSSSIGWLRKGWNYFIGSSSSSSSSSDHDQKDERGREEPGNGVPGVCGLYNLGNTCFMNSALQCLSNTPPLTEYFVSGKFKNEINKSNPLGMKGQMAEQYGKLIKEMWSGHYAAVGPKNFKLALGKWAPQFSGFQQQDSQELLSFLMDGLHEDLNRVLKKPYMEDNDTDTPRPDSEVAAEMWDRHLKRNRSVIVDLFQGQLKSTLICPECKKVSITFDPFMYLSLPLPIPQHRIIDVVFIRYNRTPEDPYAVRYSVKVSKKGTVEDLKKMLGPMCGVPAANIVVADVYGDRIYTFLNDGRAVNGIREKDVNVAYELPEIAVLNAAKPRPKSVDMSKSGDPKQATAYYAKPLDTKSTTTTTTNPANTTTTTNTVNTTPTNTTPTTSSSATDTTENKDTKETKETTKETKETTKDTKEEKDDDDEGIIRLHLMYRKPNPMSESQQSAYVRSSPMVLFGVPIVLIFSLKTTTGRDLYKMVFERVKRHLGGEGLKKNTTNNDKNNNNNNPEKVKESVTAEHDSKDKKDKEKKDKKEKEKEKVKEKEKEKEKAKEKEKEKDKKKKKRVSYGYSNYPFVLRITNIYGTACGKCNMMAQCSGCVVDCNDELLSSSPLAQAKGSCISLGITIPTPPPTTTTTTSTSTTSTTTTTSGGNSATTNKGVSGGYAGAGGYGSGYSGMGYSGYYGSYGSSYGGSYGTPSKYDWRDMAVTLCVDWDTEVLDHEFDATSMSVHLDKSVHEHAETGQKAALSLKDCLQLFTTNEKLGPEDPWYCPKCKEHRQAWKKFDIWSVPPVLVVHLKRFQYDRFSRDKLNMFVDFPVHSLDLSDIVLNKDGPPPLYDLFAISNHSGGLGGGHYTAFAKNKDNNNWFHFNDSSSQEIRESDIKTSAAYVLFYQLKDFDKYYSPKL